MSTVYRRKDSPYYWYEWKGVCPRPLSLKVSTRQQALILKTRLDIKYNDKRLGVTTVSEKKTLATLYDEYDATVIVGKNKPYAKRLRYYLQDFVGEYGAYDLVLIKNKELNAFKSHCLNTLSNKTVRDTLIAIRQMFKFAVNNDYLLINPIDRIDLPSKKATKPRIPPKLNHVKRAIQESLRECDSIYWSILLYSGLRTNDAGNLEPHHISHGIVQEKTGEVRRVILPTCMDKWGDRIYKVYPNRSGQARSRKRFQDAIMRIGGYHTDLHSLGHLIATELNKRGLSLKGVGVVLGKKATAQIYTHGDESKVREIVESISG